MAYLDYEGLQHFKDKENEQVAPVESSNTSANAYEIGKYFWHEGNFCEAKTAIAVGDAFVQNTNYTVVKVGEEIEKKANTDGYYDAMTVGNAEQLVATEGVEDSTPYVFRQTGGGGLAIGNREADTLVGGTIAWNQLVAHGNFDSSSGWTVQDSRYSSISVANNVLTQTIPGGTTAYSWQYGVQRYSGVISNPTHKHLASITFETTVESDFRVELGGSGRYNSQTIPANTKTTISFVSPDAATYSTGILIYPQTQYNTPKVAPATTIKYYSIALYDLTLMFGSTVADYIYSLEQAHAGDGVAWFKNLFPKDYYAYNAGELMSVNTSAHVTTGFNQWDEQWGVSGSRIASSYIHVLPNTSYYFQCPTGTYADVYECAEKSMSSLIATQYKGGSMNPATNVFVTSERTHYLTFTMSAAYGTTYNNDICVNISDPAKNGTYEPYESHTYPLDSELTIRGIPKLDDNNNLYYDGDIYEADGSVTRKYGIVDMGSLAWAAGSADRMTSYSLETVIAKPDPNTIGNLVCGAYVTDTNNRVYEHASNKTIAVHPNGGVMVYDTSYTDATAFKAAMSGVYLVYELATTTTETAEPYAANQIVSGDGTEEYVDAGVQAGTRDVYVPVGHNTVYQQDLRTKLQDAPDSPSEDGDYIMRRINGQNTYNKGNFAEVNGNYPNMTVGNAEQLVSTVGIEDKTPYNFRTSGGSIDIGDRETDMVVGGTIAWNQLVTLNQSRWFASSANETISIEDGIITVTSAGNLTRWEGANFNANASAPVVAGHKYILIAYMNGDYTGFEYGMQNFTPIRTNQTTVGDWTEISLIGIVVEGAYHNLQLRFGTNYSSFTSGKKIQGKNVICVNLTQMFGSTVADYIYSLEQTTAGAGVAWFKALFPKPYYDYNAGELLSVNTSSHNMTGFNQWDEQWELGTIDSNGSFQPANNMIRSKNYIPCLPSTAYHDTQYGNSYSNNIVVYFYDGNKTMIPYTGTGKYQNGYNGANGNFITPENTCYMRFRLTTTYGTTYNNDICINLSWDGERDGEYEPYELNSYALDNSLELRGVPKLDSANNLYYDGDTYESDGTVTRRYGMVDLGTLTWTYYTSGSDQRAPYFYASAPNDIKQVASSVLNNIICSKYPTVRLGDFNTVSYGVEAHETYVQVKDSSYTDAATFKTAMSGVYLVYELAESFTEEADTYQNPQIVNDFGTEEYVDYAESQGTRDVSVPVGHETVYAPNLRAKLETAPDSPQSDGDYIVRQTNGENQYVQLVIPQELPNTPGTDGTYRLQAVVSDGIATLSWVSAT